MARTPKIYKIEKTRRDRTYHQVGTLEQLVKAYGYSLEVGQSWERESGNKKINRNPKSIATLVKNLYNAANNAAANGYSGEYFSEVTVTDEDKATWTAENTEVA